MHVMMSSSNTAAAVPAHASGLWVLGMVLMVSSTVAGALGGILMKLSHTVLTLSTYEERRRHRMSWLYFLMGAVVCNGCLNVGLSAFALAFAAQSLLSPLVACQIVFNAFLSRCILGEVLTRRDILGTVLIVAGCVISGFCAPKPEQHYTLKELLHFFTRLPFVIFMIVTTALAIVAYLGSRSPALMLRRVCAAALPGSFVGLANIFAKSAASLVEEGFRKHDASALRRPLLYPIVAAAPALALGSLFFLNRALAQFRANLVVPTYISTLIVTSTLSGGIYFGELAQLSAGGALGLAAGVSLVVIGVCVQASRAAAGDEQSGGADALHLQGGRNTASCEGTCFDGAVPRVALAARGRVGRAADIGGSLDGPLLAADSCASRSRSTTGTATRA